MVDTTVVDYRRAPYSKIEGTFVVGLGHKARHGKDTAAKYIISQFGGEKFAFSDALYDVARVVFGMREKDGPLLQVLGTEVFRRKDPEVWVRTLYYKLQDRRPRIAVIPDVRFPNEVQMVKDMEGILIKVTRFNQDGTPYVAQDRPANHPSETALDGFDGWDYDIGVKDGDIVGLNQRIEVIMRSLEAQDKFHA